MKNVAPLVSTRITTSIYKGQMLEFHIPVEDDDQLTFKLEDTFTDAQVTKTGVFRWLAVSNSLLPSNHEIFSLSVSDDCGFGLLLRIKRNTLIGISSNIKALVK